MKSRIITPSFKEDRSGELKNDRVSLQKKLEDAMARFHDKK